MCLFLHDHTILLFQNLQSVGCRIQEIVAMLKTAENFSIEKEFAGIKAFNYMTHIKSFFGIANIKRRPINDFDKDDLGKCEVDTKEGAKYWRKWGRIKREIMADFVPFKEGRLREVTRWCLTDYAPDPFDKKCKDKVNTFDIEVTDAATLGTTNADVDECSSLDDDDGTIESVMPISWYPPQWLVFLMHGPPAAPHDSKVFRAELPNGPVIKEQAAEQEPHSSVTLLN